jgi:hypothetical protein
MDNNKQISQTHADEIDFITILHQLFKSRKIIFIIIFLFTSVGTVYELTPKSSHFKSTAIFEIGDKIFFNKKAGVNETKLIESAAKLEQELKIAFLYKNKNSSDFRDLSFSTKEKRLIQISVTSATKDKSINLIEDIISFSLDRHQKIVSDEANTQTELSRNIINNLKSKIEFNTDLSKTENDVKIFALNNEITNLKNQISNTNSSMTFKMGLIKAKLVDEKLLIEDRIKEINNNLPNVVTQINALKKIIIEETDNLLLLQNQPDKFLERVQTSPTLNQIIFQYKSTLLVQENYRNNLINELNSIQNLLAKINNQLENSLPAYTTLNFSSSAESIEYDKAHIKLMELKITKNNLLTRLALLEDALYLDEDMGSDKTKSAIVSEALDLDTMDLNDARAQSTSFVIFNLNQEKINQEQLLKSLVDQNLSISKLVGEISTSPIKRTSGFYIMISLALGIIFSMFFVFLLETIKGFRSQRLI